MSEQEYTPVKLELNEPERMAVSFALGKRIRKMETAKPPRAIHHSEANAALILKEKEFLCALLDGIDDVASYETDRFDVLAGAASLRSILSDVEKANGKRGRGALGDSYIHRFATSALAKFYAAAPIELHARLGLQIEDGKLVNLDE